jgi:hypothetical protein
MATTTNYGWTTPDDTDLVKDGAAAIRTLGSSIDTSFVADQGDSIFIDNDETMCSWRSTSGANR